MPRCAQGTACASKVASGRETGETTWRKHHMRRRTPTTIGPTISRMLAKGARPLSKHDPWKPDVSQADKTDETNTHNRWRLEVTTWGTLRHRKPRHYTSKNMLQGSRAWPSTRAGAGIPDHST